MSKSKPLKEGMVKRGGVNPAPKTPKKNIKPPAQKRTSQPSKESKKD